MLVIKHALALINSGVADSFALYSRLITALNTPLFWSLLHIFLDDLDCLGLSFMTFNYSNFRSIGLHNL